MAFTGNIENVNVCELNIDMQSIDKCYTKKGGLPYLHKIEPFKLSENGIPNVFHNGDIRIIEIRSRKIKGIYVTFHEKLCDLKISFDLVINNHKVKLKKLNGTDLQFSASKKFGAKLPLENIHFDGYGEDIRSITGRIKFKFRTNFQVAKQQEFISKLYLETFGFPALDSDFQINCQDKTFKFNKHLLCSISEVFEKMIENSYSTEAKSGTVEIEDFSPAVIESFQNMVFLNKSNSFNDEEMSVELLMFTNKYAIKPLKELIAKHLIESLNVENVYEIMEAAYLIDDDDLLKETAKFLKVNLGQLKDDEKWDKFQEAHPKCGAKVLRFIMFEK